ncbi:hypothetical protein QFC20_006863 [Naganishia adeliensis]|uniref:Uncharacterized protein n=1 Tax=Naganishia adeliensis TaxID=92952 RepID=A0ACC2V6C0_9TREE|nr:hypothetical protein QFC20_006863 [Naganishia adeliensis]
MGRFGKAGRTGNADGQWDLTGILPVVYSGGRALADSAELGFAAVAADATDAANAAESAKSFLLDHLKDFIEGVLIEGVLIEGVLIEGVLIEGVLIEGVLIEGLE